MARTTKQGLSLVLALSLLAGAPSTAFASSEGSSSPEGNEEFTIMNDGYGYLTANFPSEYPSEYLQEKVTNTEILMKVDALMNTLTAEEKIGARCFHGQRQVLWNRLLERNSTCRYSCDPQL